MQRLADRGLRESEAANRLGGAKEHGLATQSDADRRDARLASREQPRTCGIAVRRGQGERIWNFQPRCPPSAQFGEQFENPAQREVFVPQNVFFAVLAVLRGQQMTLRNVVDVDQVQAGVHVSGHTSVQKIDDQAPGRRRLEIPQADRRTRIDDHDRHAFPGGGEDDLLRQEFAALVVAEHVAQADRRVFGCRRAVPAVPKRGDGTRIDDLFHVRGARRLQDVLRSAHVAVVDVPFAAHPQLVQRGHVIDLPAAAQRRE